MRAIPILIIGLMLTGCGAYAPPAAPLSALEQRQTAVALEARPTLPPLAASPAAAAPQAAAPPPLPDILQVADDDPRALGSPSAPVTIYEFTDFECPFCQKFFSETRPQLIQEYVETGVVRLVARDFPLTQIHPSAMLGALAGRCAADQQMFWPMYETLFSTHQVEWGGVPNRDRGVMVELAGNLGLDQQAFRACLDDPATEQAVQAEMAAAASIGVNSTPNFRVNGQMIRGALPFSSFEILIRGVVEP